VQEHGEDGKASAQQPDEAEVTDGTAPVIADHHMQELLASEDQSWKPTKKRQSRKAKGADATSSIQELPQECSAVTKRSEAVSSCKNVSVQEHGEDGKASAQQPDEAEVTDGTAPVIADHHMQELLASEDQSWKPTKKRQSRKAREIQDLPQAWLSDDASQPSASALTGSFDAGEGRAILKSEVREPSKSGDYETLVPRSRCTSAQLDADTIARTSKAPTSTTRGSKHGKTAWQNPAASAVSWGRLGAGSGNTFEGYGTWSSSCCNEHGCLLGMSEDFCMDVAPAIPKTVAPAMPKAASRRPMPACPTSKPPPPPPPGLELDEYGKLDRAEAALDALEQSTAALNASMAQQAAQMKMIETLQEELRLAQQRQAQSGFSMPQPATSFSSDPRWDDLGLSMHQSLPVTDSFWKVDGIKRPELASAGFELQCVSPDEPMKLQQLPSVGSAEHHQGTCKPCAFFHNMMCTNGANCQFCHLCAPDVKKRRRQMKGKPRYYEDNQTYNHEGIQPDEYNRSRNVSSDASTACCDDGPACCQSDLSDLLPVNLLEDIFDDLVA